MRQKGIRTAVEEKEPWSKKCERHRERETGREKVR